MAVDPKDALRQGLQARETPASSGVSQDFIDAMYNNRLSPLMARGTFDRNMGMGEYIKFMMELLAFSSYAKEPQYDVDTWEHDPQVTLGGRNLTPDFFVTKTARYVEIYSPTQGHGQTTVDYLSNLDRQSITKTISDKSIKYTGLQIDIVTHLSTVEFPADYVKAIKAVTAPLGQRFLLFQGDKEIEVR